IAARVCLMDGTATLANATKLSSRDYEDKKKEEGMSGKIHRELPALLKKSAALAATKKPKAERDACGYLLDGTVGGGGDTPVPDKSVGATETYDLSKLLCGSQGTLGVVTEAVIKVEPLVDATGVVIASFASLL